MYASYIYESAGGTSMARVEAKSEVRDWDEQEVSGPAGVGKLTRVGYGQRLTGDLEGDASSSILIAYRPDGSARYSGYDRIVGTVGERTGSFVVEVAGTYDSTGLNATATIVD